MATRYRTLFDNSLMFTILFSNHKVRVLIVKIAFSRIRVGGNKHYCLISWTVLSELLKLLIEKRLWALLRQLCVIYVLRAVSSTTETCLVLHNDCELVHRSTWQGVGTCLFTSGRLVVNGSSQGIFYGQVSGALIINSLVQQFLWRPC